MTMLQLNPSNNTGVGGKDALLPALRAGFGSAEAFLLADGRSGRRRRTLNRLRFADLGLQPFRVF